MFYIFTGGKGTWLVKHNAYVSGSQSVGPRLHGTELKQSFPLVSEHSTLLRKNEICLAPWFVICFTPIPFRDKRRNKKHASYATIEML